MKLGASSRYLSPAEEALAIQVFGPTLPLWKRILIDDGLGIGDRPYTLDGPPGCYMIHVGPVAYRDCTSRAFWGIRRIDASFIHEMTHVWQFGKGYNVKLSSLWAQSGGSGYGFVPGQAWDDYNVEQQAKIVENWYFAGMSTTAVEFPYIEKVIRRGGLNKSKTLEELKAIP
jgi:hypothetical protein